MKASVLLFSIACLFNSGVSNGSVVAGGRADVTPRAVATKFISDLSDLKSGKVPNPYQGLGYAGMIAGNMPGNSLLKAKSGVKVLFHEPAARTTKPITEAINPQLTVVYPRSVVMAFHFKWVYSGCYKIGTKNYEPKACKIQITGSDMNRKLASQTFTFTPTKQEYYGRQRPSPMKKAVFGAGFITVTNITIALADARTNANTGLALDNFEYTGYSKAYS